MRRFINAIRGFFGWRERMIPARPTCHILELIGKAGRGRKLDGGNIHYVTIDRVLFKCSVCGSKKEYATLPVNHYSEEYVDLINQVHKVAFGDDPSDWGFDTHEVIRMVFDAIITRGKIPVSMGVQ